METVPDSVVHWLMGALTLAMGGLYIFLLKRTFHDFENKIGTLFTKLESSMEKHNAQDTKMQLLTQRVETLENKRGRK